MADEREIQSMIRENERAFFRLNRRAPTPEERKKQEKAVREMFRFLDEQKP